MTLFPIDSDSKAHSLFDDETDDTYDSSDLDDSDFMTSSRDDSEKRPTRDEADAVCKALQKKGFKKIKFLAKGSYGYVYKMGYRTRREQSTPRVVAVKVMYANQNKALSERVKVFHKAFDKEIRRRVSQHQRRQEDIDVDTAYFTEDLVYPRVPLALDVGGRTKQYTLHFMELLSGIDLFDYLHAHGAELTLKDLMTICCRLLHAIHFFHSAGVMFNDLKLENLMIDPATFHVTCIDFYDSDTQCTHTQCNERPRAHIIFTFMDPFHKAGLHEDVWRIGITILDILQIVSSCYAKKRGRRHIDESFPGDVIKEECRRSRYPSDYIRNIVQRTCDKAATAYKHDRSYGRPASTLFSQIRTSLLQMLDGHVASRPSVDKLLHSQPWSICAHSKHPPQHQRRSYRPLQRLTPLQRTRKTNVTDLKKATLYVPESMSSETDGDGDASSSTLDDDWNANAVASSDFRMHSRRRALHRPWPRRVALPTRTRRGQANESTTESTSDSSFAYLPRTRDAIRKRRNARRRRR